MTGGDYDEIRKILSVLVTPFNENMSVNYDEVVKLADHIIDIRVEGLIIVDTVENRLL